MPITKAGQHLLKKYLYLAADVARQWDPDFADYYARRYSAGDHHNRILIALARKMDTRIYALMKRRDLARRAQAGPPSLPVTYELRDRQGHKLTHMAARTLILAKLARAVVAPDRELRDRSRRDRAVAPTKALMSGRPLDATPPDAGTTAVHQASSVGPNVQPRPVENTVDNL